ncbi:hypothetical protein [Magnetovibrio blakemorei]|nr:hypothetical protein [Magnetovibrio blakemorei]
MFSHQFTFQYNQAISQRYILIILKAAKMALNKIRLCSRIIAPKIRLIMFAVTCDWIYRKFCALTKKPALWRANPGLVPLNLPPWWGAILTGYRYGELTHMTAGDLNVEAGRLWVGTSKNGKGRLRS